MYATISLSISFTGCVIQPDLHLSVVIIYGLSAGVFSAVDMAVSDQCWVIFNITSFTLKFLSCTQLPIFKLPVNVF